MVRRWLIRSLPLMLLTLCVVVWVGSYFETVWAWHNAGMIERNLGCECGSITFTEYHDFTPSVNGWHWYHQPSVKAPFEEGYRSCTYKFLGFAYQPDWGHFATGWYVIIPTWFPTLLSVLLLWLVWRKTKAKPLGGAFPIDPAASTPRKTIAETSKPGDSLHVEK